MGTNIIRVMPVIHFPIRRAFEIKDQFNGPVRGTYWYRPSSTSIPRGPFRTEVAANLFMEKELSDDGA